MTRFSRDSVMQGDRLPLLLLSVVFIVLVLVPLPWNDAVDDLSGDVFFKLGGGAPDSEHIVYVTFSEEDIAALGWPVTRDYYGYITHVLSRSGAEVIGLYALFDSPGRHYPEFDRRLVEFLETSANVCLPAALSLAKMGEALEAEGVIRPMPEFVQAAAGVGFSNLGEDAVARRVPLFAMLGDSLLSYGGELARLYLGGSEIRVVPGKAALETRDGVIDIPLDARGRLRVNYPGGLDRIQPVSFLDVLQVYEAAPDSLDFSGKLVIVDAANPSFPVMKATPLGASLPAALVHAAAAETIITGRFLRPVPTWAALIILILLAVSISRLWKISRVHLRIAALAGVVILYLAVGLVLFTTVGWILPVVYPGLLSVSAMILLAVLDAGRLRASASRNTAIEEMIAEKHAMLEDAEARLLESEARLEEERKEKRDALMALDKQMRDLESYEYSPKHKPVRFEEIVHAPGSKMEQVLGLIQKVGGDDITVLILGETGTGKELVAQAIHRTSRRNRAPFVAINCGALPETLLESELFGHEKGSFTGAQSRRKGRFELANGGTIFLDEITETTPAFQARLLRVLQEKSFERVGGESAIKVDVRVIAASNKDLKEEVEGGRFREDLYYRLTGFPIVIPPLRDRAEDIPVLARHFLRLHGYASIRAFSDRVMDMLSAYAWPGNVRELENAVRRAAILAASEERERVRASDLPQEILEFEEKPDRDVVYQSLEEQILSTLRSLKFSHSAISQTARALGNRDRGTITEYFRGMCFQAIVEHAYDLDAAAKELAGIEDEEVVVRVRGKMQDYIGNLKKAVEEDDADADANATSAFKGLPKKFHPSLGKVMDNLDSVDASG